MAMADMDGGSYLVIGFVPERSSHVADLPITPLQKPSGVHTPLRQDGYWGSRAGALSVAEHWRANPLHLRERVVVVQVVDEPASALRDAIVMDVEHA